MRNYYSPSRKSFFDEAVHGPRTILVVDDERLAQLQAECLEEGEESDACAALALAPPMQAIDNPDTKIPEDAIELDAEAYAALLTELNQGKVVAIDDRGQPVAVDREVPVDEQLAILRRRRDQALKATDWTQVPDALTAAKRKLWAEHRKALRDLPSMVAKAVKAGKPVDSIPFPTPPG